MATTAVAVGWWWTMWSSKANLVPLRVCSEGECQCDWMSVYFLPFICIHPASPSHSTCTWLITRSVKLEYHICCLYVVVVVHKINESYRQMWLTAMSWPLFLMIALEGEYNLWSFPREGNILTVSEVKSMGDCILPYLQAAHSGLRYPHRSGPLLLPFM